MLALLPLLALAGWAIAGAPSGAIAGLGVWALGLAAPRLAGNRLAGRLRARAVRWSAGAADPSGRAGPIVTLTGQACPSCGQVAYGPPTATCARCGATTTRALTG